MKLVSITLMIFLAASIAHANLSQQGSRFAAFKAANALIPHSFPTKRMVKGRTDLKIIPAYLEFEYDETSGSGRQYQSLDGHGYAAGLTHGLGEHWGFSLLGIGFKMKGEGTTLDSDTGKWGSNNADGHMTTFSFIYDPFSGGEEAFHLPLLFGLSYFSLEETSHLSSGDSSLNGNRQLKGLGLSLGLMAHWTLNKWLRLSPFGFIAEPFSDVSDTCTATGPNASCPTTLQSISKGAGGAGIEVNIRPWNFSTQILFPTSGISSYTLKWELSF